MPPPRGPQWHFPPILPPLHFFISFLSLFFRIRFLPSHEAQLLFFFFPSKLPTLSIFQIMREVRINMAEYWLMFLFVIFLFPRRRKKSDRWHLRNISRCPKRNDVGTLLIFSVSVGGKYVRCVFFVYSLLQLIPTNSRSKHFTNWNFNFF